MTKDRFGILGMCVLGAGWLVGVLAAKQADSLWLAAGLAFGVPTIIAAIFAARISRAWWSINHQEAAQPNFGSEAKRSLRFAAFAVASLAVIMGAYAATRESIYWAAFTGSLLALSAFAALRLRDLSARNSL